MDIIGILFNIAILIAVYVFYRLIKNYVPSYFDEKGKNLATKQDIAEITRKTEEVQKEFKEGFELFSSDVRFKYDFFYKQYSELYCKLYAIVIRSEYVRQYIKLTGGKELTFDDTPFIEVSKTHRQTEKLTIKNGEGPTYERKNEDIETPVSQFNKHQLCEYIIQNDSLASQHLLKLAVSYRFVYDFYSGNPEAKGADYQEIANEEEVKLIKDIIFAIVKDYNQLRKSLNLEYNKIELETGIPSL